MPKQPAWLSRKLSKKIDHSVRTWGSNTNSEQLAAHLGFAVFSHNWKNKPKSGHSHAI